MIFWAQAPFLVKTKWPGAKKLASMTLTISCQCTFKCLFFITTELSRPLAPCNYMIDFIIKNSMPFQLIKKGRLEFNHLYTKLSNCYTLIIFLHVVKDEGISCLNWHDQLYMLINIEGLASVECLTKASKSRSKTSIVVICHFIGLKLRKLWVTAKTKSLSRCQRNHLKVSSVIIPNVIGIWTTHKSTTKDLH